MQRKENNGFQQLLTKFVPYWPIFLATLIISYTLLYFYLKITPRIYETTASVLIKDEKKGEEDSKMEEILNVFGTKKIVENELEIFHSNSLIAEVVKNLNLYAPVFEEKGWRGLSTTSAYLTSPVVIEVPNTSEISEANNVYFDFSESDSSVSLNGTRYALGELAYTRWGIFRFVRNPHFYPGKVRPSEKPKLFFNLLTLDHATNQVLGNLMVSAASKQSSIINLSMKDPISAKSEQIISEIIVAYNQASAERKSSIAKNTLRFIDERLKNASKELDSVEGSIQKYRDTSGVVDMGEQSRLYLQSIETNDKQVSDLDLQLATLDEVEKYVQSKSKTGNIVPSTFNVNDPALTQLLNTLYTAETQYETLKRTTAENNPIMLGLQEEINKTKPNILENIRSQRVNIQAAKETLLSEKVRYSTMLNGVPKKERRLAEVSRQQNIKNDIYGFLLQKKEETAYSITSILPDCYIVSNPTTSGNPVSPKIPFLALLATIVPVLVCVVLISLRDLLNSKVLYRSEIERLTSVPIVGEIIFQKLKNPIVTESGARTFIAEEFRQLRLALRQQGNPPGALKRLLVTSSIKGDGKSFVSTNLAISFARSDKKVAFLEMDLHQPSLSKIFEIPKGIGITDYLRGEVSEEDIILPTAKNENLYLLPAGNLVEEPSELLCNGKLEKLLTYLDSIFDVLIIDTPPLKILTDGLLIAPYCNVILNVVRHNHTPKSNIEILNHDIEMYDIQNMAIVFNGVKNRGLGKYSYGYGHGYGYDIRSSYDKYGKRSKKKVS